MVKAEECVLDDFGIRTCKALLILDADINHGVGRPEATKVYVTLITSAIDLAGTPANECREGEKLLLLEREDGVVLLAPF